MRLINTTTLELHEFITAEDVKYAILSHTWSDEELTFDGMSSASRKSKKGWAKIKKTCEIAKAAGFQYAWVDTCCINKSSSAELSESINSMYQWYTNSEVCIVYLEDLKPNVSIERWLPRCRWMTRGWTLQELIAPREVRFFDRDWMERGSKASLVRIIQKATNISFGVLRGEQSLSSISVAARMSWAARRKTTRAEDIAYCLLGIFDVNMPLLYGEGMKAFRRLQEEIARRTYDLTILCWDDVRRRKTHFHGLLAPDPTAFSGMADLETLDWVGESFSITNSGLRLTNTLHFLSKPLDGGVQYYILLVGYRETGHGRRLAVLRLRKMDTNTFYREGPLVTVEERDEHNMEDYMGQDYYILIDEPVYTPLERLVATPRVQAIHIPSYIEVKDMTPHYFWDVEDRLFLDSVFLNEKGSSAVYAVSAQVIVRGAPVDIVILFDRRDGLWSPEEVAVACRIYEVKAYERETKWIFSPKWESECLYWPDLEFHAPALFDVTSKTTVGAGLSKTRITATLKRSIVPTVSTDNPVYSLNLEECIEVLDRAKSATWR